MKGKDYSQSCRTLELLEHLGRVHGQLCYTVVLDMQRIRGEQVFPFFTQPIKILLSAF